MTTTLLQYARTSFPGHDTAIWDAGADAELALTSHTVVAHVVGSDAAADVAATMQHHVGDGHVAAVIIRPVEPSVVPDEREDSDGVFDLPNRRVGVAVAVGAIAGAALGLAVGAIVSTTAAAIVIALFAAAAGGAVGAIAGGGRHASQRAVSQQQAPGRTVAVVAAFLHDEGDATTLARAITDSVGEYDVRIVGTDGAWHAPNN